MKYKDLLKKLQKFSEDELEQEVCLFYGDGGTCSEAISLEKTTKNNENLGCEGIDSSTNWKKGQWYILHSC